MRKGASVPRGESCLGGFVFLNLPGNLAHGLDKASRPAILEGAEMNGLPRLRLQDNDATTMVGVVSTVDKTLDVVE